MGRRVLVAGAGIAGLGAAVLLARAGFTVEVHEASSTTRPRRGVLVLGSRRVRYPLEPLAFARALGLRSASDMAFGWLTRPRRLRRFRSWERDSFAPGFDEGFEAFVSPRVGWRAYESFYRPYVEKVWGVQASELSRTVARQRISMSSPWTAIAAAFRTDVARTTFRYPRRGVYTIIEGLVQACAEHKIRIHYERPLDRDALHEHRHDHIVHTGHLRALAPASELTHRGLHVLHIALPRGTLDDTDTWYVPDARYWFGRVSQPARFSSALQSESVDVLAAEIPEGRWGARVDFTVRASELMDQLHEAGVLPVVATEHPFRDGVRIAGSGGFDASSR